MLSLQLAGRPGLGGAGGGFRRVGDCEGGTAPTRAGMYCTYKCIIWATAMMQRLYYAGGACQRGGVMRSMN